MSRQHNRQRILAAIEKADYTQSKLQEALHLSAATVSRWLAVLIEEKSIHIPKYEQHPHGGPQTAIYRSGQRPTNRGAVRPKKRTDMQRVRAYRKRMRATGEWEHTLDKRRTAYRAKHPVRDPLTSALFGSANTEVDRASGSGRTQS